METVFTLPDEELDRLLEKGFAWFLLNKENQSGKPDWQTGTLPEDLLQDFTKLENRPKDGVTYTYLYKWVDGKWWRLVVVDKEKKLVYYVRVSW